MFHTALSVFEAYADILITTLSFSRIGRCYPSGKPIILVSARAPLRSQVYLAFLFSFQFIYFYGVLDRGRFA